MHLLSAAQSSGTVSVPLQSDMTNVPNAGTSTLLIREAAQSPPAERGETQAESSIVAQFCSVCFRPRTGNCTGCGRSACEDHFDASIGRCSKCVVRKSE
eukprot:927651-Pyramimonas_sp.AAC.1